MSTKLELFLREKFHRNVYELSAEILKYCTKRIAKRNEVLCYPGETKEFFFFINSGCLRKYIIASNGVEKTKNIALEGECIINPNEDDKSKVNRILKKVFPELTRINIPVYIQAIERSELIVISSKYKELLYSEIPDFFCILHYLLEEELNISLRISRMTAKEKYKWILECRSQIMHRVPGKIIASYLGISPCTFSRVRSNNRLTRL